MSHPIAAALADLHSPLERSYRNTIYCAAELRQEAGKVTGVYCGNRWCLVCNRIRTARAIRRYQPVIAGWESPHFVTLTLKNVPASRLTATIAEMVRDFQAIKLAMKRSDGVKLVALRKLECTHNARTDEFHPHFHFVVDGYEAAHLLLVRWLARHPEDTDRRGQDIRPCDERGLRELFKYFTKLVAKGRRRVGEDDETPRSRAVPPVALDAIFQAMHGRRVYQPVGFTIAADAPDEDGDISPETATDALTAERTTWNWSQGAADWVDDTTGECLSGYEPAERFREFVGSFERGPPEETRMGHGRPITHKCAVPTCTTGLPASLLLCRAHWCKIPRSLSRRLYAAWNDGDCTDDYIEARRLAIETATRAPSSS